jgi:putative ABC transport system substrate-binding protein
MRRRSFITLLGGAAAAGPLAARAQQDGRVRRVGVLMGYALDDPDTQVRIAALMQGLQELGWTVGRNLQVEFRWSVGDADEAGRYAQELVALGPDVIVATNGSMVGALQRVTRTVPIVFVTVNDPVGAGWVESLARPGGNATGFATSEYGIAGKWLELLKQIAPAVTQVAVLRDRLSPGGTGQLGALQGAAPSFGVELRPVEVRDVDVIERAVTAFAREPRAGMIVTATRFATLHRKLIVELAARHRLPAVYSGRQYVAAGGLISYGPVTIDQYRLGAGYVDRVLKGAKPADLPVQAPTKYETVLNMKTARTLGIQVPDLVLVRADEVIE